MTKTEYPRCAVCGETLLSDDERLAMECPNCGERAIVTSPQGHRQYDEHRLREEGKMR
jgi:predicted RNA-binding Zn-ribbon protein involved in translation (DUF1610 family)